MRLSKRLHMIADLIDKDLIVADIGTDHGYIPIFVTENGYAPFAYACDVNEGPLLRAKENVLLYGVSDKVELILSDGLLGLVDVKENNPEAVVIAGMGGLLMIRILTEGQAALKNVKELILSPHSEQEEVRRFLYQIGFVIVKESMVKEDGKFYVAMKAIPKHFLENFSSWNGTDFCTSDGKNDIIEYTCDADFRYGGYLLKAKNEVLCEQLMKEADTLKKIRDNLKDNGNEVSKQKLYEVEQKLQEVLSISGRF